MNICIVERASKRKNALVNWFLKYLSRNPFTSSLNKMTIVYLREASKTSRLKMYLHQLINTNRMASFFSFDDLRILPKI